MPSKRDFGEDVKRRLLELKKARADLPKILEEVAEQATEAAIERATSLTAPTDDGELKGTNALTGEMKAHWKTDSRTKPVGMGLTGGGQYTTFLNNDVRYSSYVDRGYRIKRHFVPGLYVNKFNDLLEYDRTKKVGLIVGTKTKRFKGRHITEKAAKVYRDTVKERLDGKLKELLK